MQMKGISPMIAIVLLIAFTVAVGGLISVFLSSFTTTTTGAVQTTATNITKCAGIFIDLDVIEVSTACDTIILKNRGTQSITSIVCYTSSGDKVPPGGFGGLAAGAINSTPACPSATYNFTIGTNTSMSCMGNCLNTGVTGECKSDQACWK